MKSDMKLKKPSLKDAGNKGLYGHLGHFAKDKFIQQGHNDSGGLAFMVASSAEKSQADMETASGAAAATSGKSAQTGSSKSPGSSDGSENTSYKGKGTGEADMSMSQDLSSFSLK